jgi:DNA-binding NarL/FixJ family response regulator
MKTIRVLLAEDHALVRAGFRALLQAVADVRVVAEAGDGRAALRLIEEQQPDVVLMDIAMPGLNGLEAAARVAREFPHVRVIILSMHANEEYILQALRAGAAGYLLKDADTPELELALKTVTRGEVYLSPAVSKHVADYVRRIADASGAASRPASRSGRGSAQGAGEADSSPFERLTPRQREILQLIAEGHTTREIARILNVSAKTVETHRARLMEELDIHDVAGLVRFAIRVGLVAPDA